MWSQSNLTVLVSENIVISDHTSRMLLVSAILPSYHVAMLPRWGLKSGNFEKVYFLNKY